MLVNDPGPEQLLVNGEKKEVMQEDHGKIINQLKKFQKRNNEI